MYFTGEAQAAEREEDFDEDMFDEGDEDDEDDPDYDGEVSWYIKKDIFFGNILKKDIFFWKYLKKDIFFFGNIVSNCVSKQGAAGQPDCKQQ